MQPFSVSRLPRIIFGAGEVRRLPRLAAAFGGRALLVTGARSLRASSAWGSIGAGLRSAGIDWQSLKVSGEPSPQLVDDAVKRFGGERIDVVIGIGGGSTLDAAKAVAGLLLPGNSVMDHLEGVGPELPYAGPAVPLIAVPTTAGTGSEATKNAVLSVRGDDGFKKSFRDEQLVAAYAVVDPDLLADCPRQIIAANGMDALTQLLESYLSTRANPFTDALALSGLEAVRDGLLPWFAGEADAAQARAKMAYAALLSGITLAQVGLGSVHGLASVLGALFPIPHGVVCGALVDAATRVNIRALTERDPDSPGLQKYAHAGAVLAGQPALEGEEAVRSLEMVVQNYTARLDIPRLGGLGVRGSDVERVVAGSRGSSMETNPIVLTDAEIGEIVTKRL